MRAAIAVFAKTVGLSPVKTRLQKDLGRERTEQFYLQFCACTRAVAEAVKGQSTTPVDLIWSVPEQSAVGRGLPEGWRGLWQGMGDGLGDKLDFVYSTLLEEYDAVLLIGADAPHVPRAWMGEALQTLAGGSDFVMGPATDGGFYLFGGRKTVAPDIWRGTPYSVETTFSVLKQQLERVGRFGPDLKPLADVDTVTELRAMGTFVENHRQLMLDCQLSLAAGVTKI